MGAVLTSEAPLESVETDFGEGPVEVFFRRLNLYEMDKIAQAQSKGFVEVAFVTLVTRARKADGTKMFHPKNDESLIRRQFDPEGILKVINALKEFDKAGAHEEGN